MGKVGFFVGNCIFPKESYYNYKSSVLQKSMRWKNIKHFLIGYTLSQICKRNILIQCFKKVITKVLIQTKISALQTDKKEWNGMYFFDCLVLIVLLTIHLQQDENKQNYCQMSIAAHYILLHFPRKHFKYLESCLGCSELHF